MTTNQLRKISNSDPFVDFSGHSGHLDPPWLAAQHTRVGRHHIGHRSQVCLFLRFFSSQVLFCNNHYHHNQHP